MASFLKGLFARRPRLRGQLAEREQHELRTRLALEASGAATWLIDYTCGGIEHFDARACALAGLDADRESWPAGTFCQLLHPDDRALMQSASSRTHEVTGPGPVVEYRIVGQDGATRWLQGGGIVQRDARGRPARFIGVSIDITDRKRLESELRSTIAQLAEADRRKDEFLATLAHELRNPLAPIGNGVQILKLSSSSDQRLKRATEMMERQMSHLVRLVDDLLDVSRIARGKAPLRPETLSLNEVLAAALESNTLQLETKQLELQVQIPADTVRVHGDRVRLTQVFSNLLANAIKYTDPGGRIAIRLQRDEHAVVVSVQDTGAGIPRESLSSVFELFAQLGSSRQSPSGLGIGLALVRQLVVQHGGEVQAYSAGPGRGSTFTVRLPLIESPASEDAARPASIATATPPRRVLVVDDNTDAAESMKCLLELMGHHVQLAADGLQAIAATRAFAPDVIFMDIGMPTMDGIEAAQRIAALKLDKAPQLVALTGWGQESDRERTRRAGFVAHLVKPVEQSALQRVLC